MKSWTRKHLAWVKTLRFERAAQEATYRYSLGILCPAATFAGEVVR
jgi:hypothetical protein